MKVRHLVTMTLLSLSTLACDDSKETPRAGGGSDGTAGSSSNGGTSASGGSSNAGGSSAGTSASGGSSSGTSGGGSSTGGSASGGSGAGGSPGSGGSGGSGETAEVDVCAFQGEATLGEPDAEGFRDVAPTHPLIWYAGRIDCANAEGPALAFPGSIVRVRFSGTALTLRLKDFGGGTEKSTNYYDVSVDGAEPRVLEVSPQTEEYVLAEGLAAGEHVVTLGKRTEASPDGNPNAGKGVVLGFRLQGDALLPTPGPARRLEFIGDSITCGYGIEVATADPSTAPFTTRNENGRKAYGALAAQLLSAEYVAVAYSGRGMSRNYADSPGETVPDFYLDTVPDDESSSTWDPTRYVPHAIVVNVGANDYSTEGVNRTLFVERYTAFLETLRGYYPETLILCVIGPTLNDGYPAGANAWTNARADVQAAIAARTAAGDANVHYLAFEPQSSPYGEDWHPSAATQQTMADQTATRLRELLGWD